MKNRYLELAIKKSGGPVSLSKMLRISSQAISQWKKVPAKHCLAVESLTGISRNKLRPDIFGKVRLDDLYPADAEAERA